jgi:uncharacterized protein with GYD domain
MQFLSPAPSWVVFAVLSAVLLGIYDVAKKASVQDNSTLRRTNVVVRRKNSVRT